MTKIEYMKKPKNITFSQAFNEILELFNHDKDKALKWYMTPHEQLDNMTPFEMIKQGKGRKLMKLVRMSI